MVSASFGVQLFQHGAARDTLADVALVERLGFASVWLADAQLTWRDAYALLGAAAVTTTRIQLGVGVTNPFTRHLTVAAGGFVTLQELSAGRMLLGLGVGGAATGMVGLPRATRAQLAAAVQTLRVLAAGEVVSGPQGEMRLAFGAPAMVPPIVLSASGPNLLRLAGQVGDGVLIGGGACTPERLRAKLACVQEGRAAAARRDQPFVTRLTAPCAVHAERAKAIAAVRGRAAGALLNQQWGVSVAAQQALAAARTRGEAGEHPHAQARGAFAAALPDAVVAEFAIVGTAADCRAQVRALLAVGIDEIVIQPFGVDSSTPAAVLETFAREVLAPLQRQDASH